MERNITRLKNDANKAGALRLVKDVKAANGVRLGSRKALISGALREYEEELFSKERFKPTLAEYLKLLQTERELETEAEPVREITVTWIEPAVVSED